MRDKTVAAAISCIIFLCMFGCIPQYIYNHYFKASFTSDEISIAWEEIYPFAQDEKDVGSGTGNAVAEKLSNYVTDNPLEAYTAIVSKVENIIEYGFNNNFLFRIPIVELNGRILKLVGIKQIIGFDTVIDLGDGYLTLTEEEKDIQESANEVNMFSAWLKKRNIDFLYVQAPFKIEEGSPELSGYTDFSNVNADNFLSALDDTVYSFDLRKEMQNDFGGDWKGQFFKTDHHWLPETGMWAAVEIAELLNEKFGYEIKTEVFDIENFNVEVYEDWLLGSLGKKVTLGYADAESLKIYYPKYETRMRVKVKSLGIDITGNFYNTLIYQRVLRKCNYYDWNSYWAYGYGDRALIEIDNLDIDNGKKILMIKDSFADTVYPFLSLGIDRIDVIDMRFFTGSLKSYIEENDPDMVIFLCNPSSLQDGEITRNRHDNIFDLQ